jgi:hypothetical protein
MHAFSFVLVLGCLALATIADAGLAPTKGSQLVTVSAGGGCAIPGHPNAAGFATRVTADGTLVPFTIPPKQILVLTDVVVSTTFQTSGHVFLVNVLVGNAAGGNAVTGRIVTSAASGAFDTTFAPPNGIVVKSGSNVCIEAGDFAFPGAFVGTYAFAHGYLAADK